MTLSVLLISEIVLLNTFIYVTNSAEPCPKSFFVFPDKPENVLPILTKSIPFHSSSYPLISLLFIVSHSFFFISFILYLNYLSFLYFQVLYLKTYITHRFFVALLLLAIINRHPLFHMN